MMALGAGVLILAALVDVIVLTSPFPLD